MGFTARKMVLPVHLVILLALACAMAACSRSDTEPLAGPGSNATPPTRKAPPAPPPAPRPELEHNDEHVDEATRRRHHARERVRQAVPGRTGPLGATGDISYA